MPNETGHYSNAERRSYDPGPCHLCGGKLQQGWINMRPAFVEEMDGDWWILGEVHCPNQSCTS